MKTMACSSCGCEMWRGRTSLPEGEAMCHPCRRKTSRYLERERVAAEREERRTQASTATCPVCSRSFEPKVKTQRYCTSACRNLRRSWGQAKTQARGYGRTHQKVREEWRPLVEAGSVTCCLCGLPIAPDDTWHLDHTPERDGYRGAAHALCNVRDGARRGAMRSRVRAGGGFDL